MQNQAQQFLEKFAEVIVTQQVSELRRFYFFPSLIIDDEHNVVLDDEEKLLKWYEHLFETFDESKITGMVPEVRQTMRLSATLLFVNMRWQFFSDEQHEVEAFSCAASYTLQRIEDEDLKIVVTVVDDDQFSLPEYFSELK